MSAYYHSTFHRGRAGFARCPKDEPLKEARQVGGLIQVLPFERVRSDLRCEARFAAIDAEWDSPRPRHVLLRRASPPLSFLPYLSRPPQNVDFGHSVHLTPVLF